MEDQSGDMENRILQTFNDFDKDKNGSIDRTELDAALKSLGMEISSGEIEEIMDRIESKRSGVISYEEFKVFMMHVLNSSEDEELGEVFALLDRDEDGWINALEVRYALHCLGEDIREDEAQLLIKAIVGETADRVSKDAFIQYIRFNK